MATLAAQQIGITGPAISFVAAGGGGDNIVGPDSRTFLQVKNGSGSPITVTVDVPRQLFGQNLPDVPVTVPAGEERPIGHLGDYGLLITAFTIVSWTYSAVTSVTVACIRI